MTEKDQCGRFRCARYEMTQLEFRRLRGELWDQSFISSFGKAASKLYREIYQKDPKLRYSRMAKRNHVHKYPCGILEQAYREVTGRGVPLVKPGSSLAREIERKDREYEMRGQPPQEAANADMTREPTRMREIIRDPARMREIIRAATFSKPRT
jgi:hypothetical protein